MGFVLNTLAATLRPWRRFRALFWVGQSWDLSHLYKSQSDSEIRCRTSHWEERTFVNNAYKSLECTNSWWIPGLYAILGAHAA